MYFRDETCETNKTMKNTQDHNVYKLLQADWAGIVVITKTGRVVIESGDINFSQVDVTTITTFLENHADEIFKKTTTVLSGEEGHFFSALIREDLDYYVYSVTYRIEPFNTESLAWYRIYIDQAYEKVLLENKFSQEQNYFKNVFDSKVVGICNFDLNGQVVAYNEAAQEMFSYPSLSGVSWNIRELSPIDERWADIQEIVIRGRRRYTVERCRYGKVLDTCFYNLILAPIISNKGQVLGVVLLCSDITETVLLEEENQQLNQFALLGEIATGVAHDVRNPLMNIQSLIGLLKKTPDLTEESVESLDTVIHEVERINLVIEQLLSYVDMSSRTSDVYVDLNEIIDKSISVINRNKGSKHIDFLQYPCTNLPLIKGNPTSLHQAMVNLLLNAVQAIPSKGTISVTSRFQQDNQKICIEISDTGEGIPYHVQKQLFKHFYSTKSDGIGFGLSILKRVIAEHGGQIEYESHPGVGTTFFIFLPVAFASQLSS